MKRKTKERLIFAAARSVEAFYPELKDTFICPTCLGHFPASTPHGISEGHILPEAAGGRISTLLCRITCNNTFGKDQDLWLGEYLRVLEGGPFNAKVQTRHFDLDGQRVNGRYERRAGGSLNVLIREDWNPPGTREAFEASTARAMRSGSLSMRFALPVAQKKDYVDCGFLTAAYLLWFRMLGYSWALQNHLDPVREQIRNPNRRTLPARYCAVFPTPPSDQPWLGAVKIGGEIALGAGLANRVILFPPVDRPGLYDLLPSTFEGQTLDVIGLPFGHQANTFGTPVGLAMGDRLLVAPDVVVKGRSVPILYLPTDGGRPTVLYPTSEEDWQRIVEDPNEQIISAKPPVQVAAEETGRPRPGHGSP